MKIWGKVLIKLHYKNLKSFFFFPANAALVHLVVLTLLLELEEQTAVTVVMLNCS